MKETRPDIAKIAARGLRNPDSIAPYEVKLVCASALAQFEKEPKLAGSLQKLIRHVREFGDDWAAGALSVDRYAEIFAEDLRNVKGK